MKLTKKVLGVVVTALIGATAFAQVSQAPFFTYTSENLVSNTRNSTVGLYYTDVDNFMSVTRWNTVKPETFFGHIGYVNELNFGFAKQFKDVYIGTSFVGQLDGLTSGNILFGIFNNSNISSSQHKFFILYNIVLDAFE